MRGRLLSIGCVAAAVIWAFSAVQWATVRPAAADTPLLQIETGGHLSLIRALQVTRDGKWLISASDDKTIRIWDLQSGRLKRVLRGEIGDSDHGKIYALAISPDGKLLAAGGSTGRTGGTAHPIRLYDFASG